MVRADRAHCSSSQAFERWPGRMRHEQVIKDNIDFHGQVSKWTRVSWRGLDKLTRVAPLRPSERSQTQKKHRCVPIGRHMQPRAACRFCLIPLWDLDIPKQEAVIK